MTDGTPERTVKIPDSEIRDWARSTGRTAPVTGRVPDSLRAVYMAELAGLGHGPDIPADPASQDPPARGPESVPKPPPAKKETTPRRVKPQAPTGLLGRARAWFNGASTTTTKAGARTTTPKAQPERPRTPLTRLVETAWGEAAGIMEHVNVPVARTMAWQAPYVGIVTDDVLSHTVADKILQPLARAQTSLQGLGAMLAMPVVVGLMTAEAGRPDAHSMAGAARRQIYQRILVASIDAQLEMFGSPELAAKVKVSAADRDRRQREVDDVTGMIFAELPVLVELTDDMTPEQIAEAQAAAEQVAARERELREAAAAIRYMTAPSGPDLRGQAGASAAAAMGRSGQAAAAAEAAAIDSAGVRVA